MSAGLRRVEVWRPATFKAALFAFGRNHLDLILRPFRLLWPIANFFDRYVFVTRNDDVREVLLENGDFNVEAAQRLSDIMDGAAFMLGEDRRDAFERIAAPLKQVVWAADIDVLAQACGKRAAELIAEAGGELEIVDFIGQVTFDVFCKYIGVTQPQGHNLRIMVTRCYEYMVIPFEDRKLKRQAKAQAKALRDHLDGLIAARKGAPKDDEILGRLVDYQRKHASSKDRMSNEELRANLIGLLVGLPQVPVLVAQALEQLLSRPSEFADAAASARAGDVTALARYVFEAARFDPMAPFLVRRCVRNHEIASGSLRKATIKKGAKVFAVLLSAVKDPRRVADPEVFDAGHGWATYLHFGYGLHTCFSEQTVRAVVPPMFERLLACDGLGRAPGRRGHLVRRGFFPDQLWVTYTPPASAAARARQPALTKTEEAAA